jgi:hypothetical protein
VPTTHYSAVDALMSLSHQRYNVSVVRTCLIGMYGDVATHIKDAPKEVGVKTPLEQAACSLSHTLQAKASSKLDPRLAFF